MVIKRLKMSKKNLPFIVLFCVLSFVAVFILISILQIPYLSTKAIESNLNIKVDPHFFFKGSLISAHIVVVLLITVIFWKLFLSIEKREFGDLSALWALNLLYLLVAFWANCKNAFELDKSLIANRDMTVEVVDILQTIGYFVFVIRVKNQFRFKIYIDKHRRIIIFGVFLISLGLGSGFLVTNHFFSLSIAVFRACVTATVILFSGFILKRISSKYKGSPRFLFGGMIVYSSIQFLTLFELYKFDFYGHHITTIGWITGLLSKLAIFWGLLQIFSIETHKSIRMEQILFRTFHELLNSLYGIKTPVNKILSPSWNDIKPREEAKEINNVFQTVISIIDATKIVMRGEFKNLDFTNLLDNDIDVVVSSKKSSISLNTLVEVSLIPIKEMAGHDIKIFSDFGAGCEINCFRHEIIQVLVNILKNAYEAFPTEGAIHITTRKKYVFNGKEQNWVNITIEDNGPGIPKAIQSEIFTEGYSTKSSEGRGMGLTIVKEIIESKYGSLLLESPIKNRANGTKFIILFNKNR